MSLKPWPLRRRLLSRYITGPFWRTVNACRRAWRAAREEEYVVLRYEDVLELTTELEEHPEGYDGPCNCALCRSYG